MPLRTNLSSSWAFRPRLAHNCCGIPSHRQKAEFKELQARLANANANVLLAHTETDRLLRVLTPTPTPPSPHHRTRAAGVPAEDIDDIPAGKFEPWNLVRGQRPSNNEDESSAELSSGKDQGIAVILVWGGGFEDFFFIMKLPRENPHAGLALVVEGRWPRTRLHGSNLPEGISSMSVWTADVALQDVGDHLKHHARGM